MASVTPTTPAASDAWRLFVALWPDTVARQALQHACDRLPRERIGRRVEPERLHLTLHFIGAMPPARLPALRAALDLAVEPCTLQLDRLEAWPRGLLVWRASVVPAALAEGHRRIGQVLSGLGLPVERRAFRPHVTLARRAAPDVPLPLLPPLDWPVHGHRLVRSSPLGGYEPLADWRWPGATCRT